jgi:hypothetical protein
MTNWYDQFAVRREKLADHFHAPAWSKLHVPVDQLPGRAKVVEDLWSVSDGYFVLARTELLQPDGNLLRFDSPVAIITIFALSLDAVQWHLRNLKTRPKLMAIKGSPHVIPPFTYGQWRERFECSESASYHLGDGSGAFVDKHLSVGPLSIYFQSRRNALDEFPYLLELRHKK